MNKEAIELLEDTKNAALVYEVFRDKIPKGVMKVIQEVHGNIDQALALLAKPCEWKWDETTKRYTTEYSEKHKCGYEVSVPMSMEVKQDLGVSIFNCPFCGQPIKEITNE